MNAAGNPDRSSDGADVGIAPATGPLSGSAVPGAPESPDHGLRGAVEQVLLDMGYGRLPQALAMTVAVSLIFIVLFWAIFPSDAKVAWIIGLLTVSALRFGLWWAYARTDGSSRAQQKWRTLLFAGAVAAGLSWSFGPVMLMPNAGHVESLLLVLTALTVSAVSVSAMGPQVVAIMGFQAAIMIPTALALIATGGDVERLAGAVVLAGMVSLMIVARASTEATRSLVETEMRLSRSVAETSAARERAEAASDAKTRFLANMSHELRSPLNAVIGAAQLLKAGERDPQRQEQMIDAIQRSGSNLLGLIDDILDLARIEAGELKIVRQDFHLLDCVESALATAGLAARAKGLQLACIVEPTMAPWRHGDAGALRQVLLNLLGNAVKFTLAGDVVVRLQSAAEPGLVRISVTDTGVGITAAALPHVFEAFRQGDDGAGRRFGGSGLGLTIVRELVEGMAGTISVESRPGEGTTFVLQLQLPLARDDPPELLEQRWQIAYVEPHPASAEALHALLLRLGCEGTPCADASQLRAWCTRVGPSAGNARLLVCADTLETQTLLQLALQLLPPDRVIGMTGMDAIDVAVSVGQPVLTRSLTKPVSRSSLASGLVRAGDVSGIATEPAQIGRDADGSQPTPVGQHLLVVEDDAVNRAIVQHMLEHAGFRVDLAPDGQSALIAIRKHRYDLVLMDWQMPDIDGLEATRRIRAGDAGDAARTVPIVALTANAFAQDRQACLQAGMNDFLTKPVQGKVLIAAVKRWAGADNSAGQGDMTRSGGQVRT